MSWQKIQKYHGRTAHSIPGGDALTSARVAIIATLDGWIDVWAEITGEPAKCIVYWVMRTGKNH